MATTTDMAPTRRKSASSNTKLSREEELENQISKLQDDLQSITDTLAKLTGEKVSEAKHIAQTEFKQLKRKGQEVLDDVQDHAGEIEKQVKDVIRERPLSSVATALGIGFVLALLTRN